MVDFENIHVENGVLTAVATNLETGKKENITARLDGSLHSSKDWDIVKATWNIIDKYKGKNFPKNKCSLGVVWRVQN